MNTRPTLGTRGAMLVVVLLLIPGAGATAGVTFAGDVSGEATTKVDQALFIRDLKGVSSKNDLGTVSDDGTKFRFAANVHQGMEYKILIDLDNEGDERLNGRIELKVPEPLEVEIRERSGGVEVARLSMTTWLIEVHERADEGSYDLKIVIAVPDDATPGFYTSVGEIRPAEV